MPISCGYARTFAATAVITSSMYVVFFSNMQVALDNPLHVNLAARDRSNFAHSGLYLTTRNGTGQFNILYRIRSNSSAAMNNYTFTLLRHVDLVDYV